MSERSLSRVWGCIPVRLRTSASVIAINAAPSTLYSSKSAQSWPFASRNAHTCDARRSRSRRGRGCLFVGTLTSHEVGAG